MHEHMTSNESAPKSALSLIHRTVIGLFDPSRQSYLRTLRDGIPGFTKIPSQAATWFTTEAATRIIQMLPDHRLVPVPVRYVRPAADPLGWRCANECTPMRHQQLGAD